MDKFWKKLFIGLGLGFVVFIVLFFWGKKEEILKVISLLNWKIVLLLSGLSFSNYLVRFFRWHYYLKILQLQVSYKDSFSIFFSGLALTVSPGKFGELLKTLLLKKKYNYPISQTTSVVFSERVSDLIGVLILSFSGIVLIDKGWSTFIIAGIMITLIFFIFLTATGRNLTLKIISFTPILKNHLSKFQNLFTATKLLLHPKIQLFSLLPSIFAWFLEALELYLIFHFFKQPAPLLTSVFIYSFATLIGGISMLPGGLGSSELTLVGLMITLLHFSKSSAIAYSLIIRFFTLWFAVLIGGLVLLIYLKKELNDGEENSSV
jgi:uncharacterized protein (TIRG00374 family)